MLEAKQRLIFKNTLLDDTDTIKLIDIKDGETITVVEAGSGLELFGKQFNRITKYTIEIFEHLEFT
jgi:hypothetical protein